MTEPVTHGSFSIERTYPASPARVFAAFADPAAKRRWQVEGEGWDVESFDMDFRVGGLEASRFRFQGGPPITFDGAYQDIVPNERIVFVYRMTVDANPISASLTTIELTAAPGGTRLKHTEHGAYFGPDQTASREEGTLGLLDALAAEIARS